MASAADIAAASISMSFTRVAPLAVFFGVAESADTVAYALQPGNEQLEEGSIIDRRTIR